jgi:tRNA A64-2'-O-ribosylphosphate transferase
MLHLSYKSLAHRLKALNLDLEKIRTSISKPLKPSWTTPASGVSMDSEIEGNVTTIVCCVASNRWSASSSGDPSTSQYQYIQGAGDDSENWSEELRLTPEALWAMHVDTPKIRFHSDEEFRTAFLANRHPAAATTVSLTNVADVEGTFCIGTNSEAEIRGLKDFDLVVSCDSGSADQKRESSEFIHEDPLSHLEDNSNDSIQRFARLRLECGSRKLGSRALRTELPKLESCMDLLIKSKVFDGRSPRLLFACETGNDLAVGMAVVVLCTYYDQKGV